MTAKRQDNLMKLWQLEALDKRLLRSHPMKPKVQQDLIKEKTGIKGEKEVDYPLRFLDKQKYFILHNVRLKDEQGFFQIDKLILTEKYILILEVKNWFGTVIFGENSQVTRIDYNNKEEGFKNPISQAKLQQHRLKKWLHPHVGLNFPIEFLVVISFPSTIIKSSTSEQLIPQEVIHNNDLYFKIEKLTSSYSNTHLSKDKLIKLANRLTQAHQTPEHHILDSYHLTKNDLIKGVFCPFCEAVPMLREKRKWTCQHEHKHRSIDAHITALNDYKLLVDNKITNRDAREFLQVESPFVVRRFFLKAKFDYSGSTSSRFYYL
ncbi:nuclease-related domain-containing protein [Virgibacillus ainsalahensis]